MKTAAIIHRRRAATSSSGIRPGLILLASLFILAGCSSPKPPPSGYAQPWDADNTNTIGTVQQ